MSYEKKYSLAFFISMALALVWIAFFIINNFIFADGGNKVEAVFFFISMAVLTVIALGIFYTTSKTSHMPK